MYKLFVFSICVFHVYAVLDANEGPLSLDPKMNRPEEKKFIPTKEWQVVAEGIFRFKIFKLWFLSFLLVFVGQAIPPGLHVRIDMQTGKKEAKLLEEGNDGGNSNSALISTETSVDDSIEEVKPELDYSEIKEALKKIKNDAKETSEGNVGKGFRTYDQIKEEMMELEQSIKTEYEIVKELVAKYLSTKDDLERQLILSDLEFYVHQYDNAQDFVKMGGFSEVVLPALNSTKKDLRSSAAFLLGKG